MMPAIGTSIEQSDRLIKAGMNPETAHFEWCQVSHGLLSDWQWELHTRNQPIHKPKILKRPPKYPAWSFLQLLWSIPKQIVNDRGWTSMFFEKNLISASTEKITLGYVEVPVRNGNYRSPDISFSEDDPMETAVKLIEWLHENGHSLNNIHNY